MKKVHWKTRQAIIRQYEEDTRIVIRKSRLTLVSVTLRDLVLMRGIHGGTSPIVQIELDAFFPQTFRERFYEKEKTQSPQNRRNAVDSKGC